jgi:uncharacterized lipoprotein YddW (UPF0748 family)
VLSELRRLRQHGSGREIETMRVTMQIRNLGGLAILACALSGWRSVAAQEDAAVIDSGRYANDAAARAAWQPMSGTVDPLAATLDGAPALRLRCNFAGTRIERASWDRQVRLDLSNCRGVEFQFFCRDAAPVSYFSLYFQSGDGWYSTTFFPETAGWNRITVDKSSMTTEGKPAGWSAIRTIRLSAWRGGDTDTEFCLRDLRRTGVLGVDTLVALVRCESAARSQPQEVRAAQEYCARTSRYFEEMGIGCATLSDVDLSAGMLRGAKLVVLPHNPAMPEATVDTLVSYLKGGGRLLTFYGMPARLRSLTKIGAGDYARPSRPGEFSAMRFTAGALPGAPASVGQKSWNIAEPKPVAGASRTVAEWVDDQGRLTGHAAVVASDNCIAMSHVLLGDDALNKRQMLLAMAGYLAPDIWKQAADASLARIGCLAGFRDYASAAAGIVQLGGQDARVSALLEETRRLRDSAINLQAGGRFSEACARADAAARDLMDAFCAAQRPLPGEFRAFWCHSAFGVEGMNWDKAIGHLAENGFTAILPNMLWGGLAYYPSAILPVAPEVATNGDQVAQCLAACRKHALQIHVWKVNWNLSRAPKEFIERMRREGRLQANSRGQEEPWLCPSHPENQKLETDSMVEVARRYPVDGIHFDYIRYPDGDHCFCAGCRERFSRTVGGTISQWPQDVLRDGPHRQAWLDWRRGNITAVVKAVSEQARTVRPKVRLSAAVFRNWPMDRDDVGQDWKLWCERGYLDFVCPMDYTASDAQFGNWVKHQRTWAGAVPCYPGIGAWVLTPDRVIGQIQITRQHATKGFVVFNYDASAAQDLLPQLGRGITRKIR